VQESAGADELLLEHIYIQPEFRRKGLATALVRAALTDRETTNSQACLVLNDHSLPLVNLLLKAGLTFKIQGNP
jgi:GNAT superfamily N-acetyltransferase